MIRLRHLLTTTLLLCLAFAKAQEVTFSANGGFYDEPFALTLSCNQQDKVIHYTTNGNMPTAADPVYQAPLLFGEALYSHSDIFKVQNSPDQHWVCPQTVKKCIVIRAAAFDAFGNRVSPTVTQSYFLQSLGCDTHGLPVMSLCVDSLDLFDYETGIFVPGVYFDPENPDHTGNYFQTGKEWERPTNIEFYETDNQGINQLGGIRTHGYSTRRFPQKGLKIYAREEYGKKRFKYPFFEDTDIISFKHLKVKPFQGGWNGVGCQDYICGKMVKDLNVPGLASRPMVLFLNGEYWGIYFLQEKPDERYLEDHFDVDIDDINIIKSWGGGIDYGDNANYLSLYQWIQANDLSDESNYQYLTTLIDIDNFIDYEIFEIFSANLDWPANNMRCWQEGNGPWRWMFFDGDACLYRLTKDFDAFANATYEGDGSYPTNIYATLFFRKLMKNARFKAQFLSRFYDLLGSSFSYSNTRVFYEEIHDLLEDEIPNQIERYDNPSSFSEWERVMKRVDRFLANRTVDIDKYLIEYFAVENTSIEALYPNPASQQINIEVYSDDATIVEVAVFDVMGQMMHHSREIVGGGSSVIQLPINLRSGVYHVKVGQSVKKVVVIN